MERITFEDYFMILAFWASKRSPDESTRHGCVIANYKNQIISMGYNGYPAGCRDELLPQNRPSKYDFFIHAENSAILNSNLSNLDGCKVYISGPPCKKCLGLLIQVGIKEIIYGPIVSTHINSPYKLNPENDLKEFKLIKNDIIVREWNPNNKSLLIKNLKEIIDIC